MATGYLLIQERRAELIRKSLQGSVFLAPGTAAGVTAAGLFDATTGDLKALPAGYVDLGIMTDAGVKGSRAIKTADLMGWGFDAPVRTDITGDTTTVTVDCQETKLETIGLYTGADPLLMVPGTNGVLEVPQPTVNAQKRYRVLVVAVDESNLGEVVVARFLPAAGVTAITDQIYANQAAALTWGVTLTGYVDTTLGYDVDWFFGGAGWKALLGDIDAPRIVTCSTTSASATITATTGTFSSYDVGRSVSGAGIPPGTEILTFTDATHVIMTAPATATAASVAVEVA